MKKSFLIKTIALFAISVCSYNNYLYAPKKPAAAPKKSAASVSPLTIKITSFGDDRQIAQKHIDTITAYYIDQFPNVDKMLQVVAYLVRGLTKAAKGSVFEIKGKDNTPTNYVVEGEEGPERTVVSYAPFKEVWAPFETALKRCVKTIADKGNLICDKAWEDIEEYDSSDPENNLIKRFENGIAVLVYIAKCRTSPTPFMRDLYREFTSGLPGTNDASPDNQLPSKFVKETIADLNKVEIK